MPNAQVSMRIQWLENSLMIETGALCPTGLTVFTVFTLNYIPMSLEKIVDAVEIGAKC